MTSKDINTLIEKMSLAFATKQELKQELENIRNEMATKDELRKVMTVLDKVLHEVLAMRQEQDFHIQKHRDIDGRFEKIESVVFTHS